MKALVLLPKLDVKFYVYLITNIVNGKMYVGKSVNVKERWRCHVKAAKTRRKKDFTYIHRAINKYGSDNFKISTLAEFDYEDDAYKYETIWIKCLKTNNRNIGYNLNCGGIGGIIPNAETKKKLIAAQARPDIKKAKSEKMKARHKENPGFLGKINKGNQYTKGRELTQVHKDQISKANLGKKASEETKKKMSESQMGHVISEETRNKIALTNMSHGKFSEKDVLEIREKYISGEYSYIKLAREYNISGTTVRRIVKRIRWRHI